MKQVTGLFLLLTLAVAAGAQNKSLVKEGFAIGSPTNDVTKATIQAETEKTVSIQAEYKGFNEKNKAYKMTATILNQLKKPMKEFEPITLDLDRNGGVADFTFVFTQRTGVKYAPEGIKSSYIEFSVAEKKGDESSMFATDILGLGATKFVFQLKKNWKVKVATTVEVKLVPLKSAATIKP